MPEGRRLHVCLGTECNNNCLFCMEEERGKRRTKLGKVDTEAVLAMLASEPDRAEVMFTAGEPTLRPDLPDLLRRTRALGYGNIGLISNGRRLAYKAYLIQLLDAGLQHLIVSVHGPDAAIHDGLTRTPGSFTQVAMALANIRATRNEGRRYRFSTSTVLNRRNLAVLPDLVRFLGGFEPDEIVFNAIQPQGRGERYFQQLVPRYSEMVEAVRQALEPAESLGMRIRLLDIPPCVTRSLPESVVGFVEAHRHFEPDSSGAIESVPLWRREAPELRSENSGESTGFAMVTKEVVDEFLRGFGPSCDRCAVRRNCEGIWKSYSEAFGFEEFVPFETSERGTS